MNGRLDKLSLDNHSSFGTYANSANPMQMPLKWTSDQGLYCLLAKFSMQNTVKAKIFTRNQP